MFSSISSGCRDTASASWRQMWAAASAARHPFTRRRSWSRWSPVTSVGRCAGQATGWRILPRRTHGFDEIVDAELALDKDGRILALAAEVIGDIGAYSIFPWTAALEPVQVVSFMPAPIAFRPTTGMYARSRRAKRRPGLIAASGVRSRPS